MNTYVTDRVAAPAAIAADAGPASEAVRDHLRVPGFSATGEGIAESAALTREHRRRVCRDARVVPTAGHPVVVGTRRSARPDALEGLTAGAVTS